MSNKNQNKFDVINSTNLQQDDNLNLKEKGDDIFSLKDLNYLVKNQQVSIKDIEIFIRIYLNETLENKTILLNLTLKSDSSIFSMINFKLFLFEQFSEWLTQYEDKSKVHEISKLERPEKVWEHMTALLCVCERIPLNQNDLRTYKIGKKINKLEKNIDNQPTIKVKCKKLIGIWKKDHDFDDDETDKKYKDSNQDSNNYSKGYRNENDYSERSVSRSRKGNSNRYDEYSDSNTNTADKDFEDNERYDNKDKDRFNNDNRNFTHENSLISKKRDRLDENNNPSYNNKEYNSSNNSLNNFNSNSFTSPSFSHNINNPNLNNNNLGLRNNLNPGINPINNITPQIFHMLQKNNHIPSNVNYNTFINNLNMVKNNHLSQVNQSNSFKGNPNLDQSKINNKNLSSKSILKKVSNISARYSKQQNQQKKPKIRFEDDRLLEKIKIFKLSDEPDCNEVSEEEYIKIQKEILSNPNYRNLVADMRMREISMEKENINKAKDKLKLAKESLKNMIPQAFSKPFKEVFRGENYDLADSTKSTEKLAIKIMNGNCLAVNYYKEIDIPPCPKINEEKMFDFCDESIPKLENEYSKVDEIQAEKEKAKQVVMKQINDFIVENRIQPEISVKLQNKIQQLENFSVEDLPELYSSINNELYSMSNPLNSLNFPKHSISNTTNIPNHNIGNYTFPNKNYSNLPNVNLNSGNGNGRYMVNFPKNFPVNSGVNINHNPNFNSQLNNNFKQNTNSFNHGGIPNNNNTNGKQLGHVNSNMHFNNLNGVNSTNDNTNFTSPGTGSHWNVNNNTENNNSSNYNPNNNNNNVNNHSHNINPNQGKPNYHNNNTFNNFHQNKPRNQHNNTDGGFRESKMDPSRYKTKPCNKYHGPIGCTFDEKCFFIHDPRYKGVEIPNFEPENYREESYKGPPTKIGFHNTNSHANQNSNYNPNYHMKSGYNGNSNYQKL
jgi:hypothetical protein